MTTRPCATRRWYVYPAMARAFRSGGGQIATQFQYDPMCLAAWNKNWQTHYLNLCYTPGKAISFAIAAEVFRRIPRLSRFGDYPASNRFGDFRVSYEEELGELVSEDSFMYSNDTSSVPPAPEKLQRVWGCGSSPVVSYSGTGAYFLDREDRSYWRLQVYPDAVMVADPYSGGGNEKTRILWQEREMTVRIPELGGEFQVTSVEGGAMQTARESAFKITPGEYVLSRGTAEIHTGARGDFLAPPGGETVARGLPVECPGFGGGCGHPALQSPPQRPRRSGVLRGAHAGRQGVPVRGPCAR